MPKTVQCIIKLFADDSKIFARISHLDDCKNLQKNIAALQDWANEWLIKFNSTKCKTTKCKILRLGPHPPTFTYTMHSNGTVTTLDESSCERDLGVLMDNKLKFSNHVDAAVSKANKILGLIKRTLTYMDDDNLSLLFKSLVRPHLEYANVVWALSYKGDLKKLEDVQRRATRLLPSLSGLDYSARLRKMKLPTTAYRRKKAT